MEITELWPDPRIAKLEAEISRLTKERDEAVSKVERMVAEVEALAFECGFTLRPVLDDAPTLRPWTYVIENLRAIAARAGKDPK